MTIVNNRGKYVDYRIFDYVDYWSVSDKKFAAGCCCKVSKMYKNLDYHDNVQIACLKVLELYKRSNKKLESNYKIARYMGAYLSNEIKRNIREDNKIKTYIENSSLNEINYAYTAENEFENIYLWKNLKSILTKDMIKKINEIAEKYNYKEEFVFIDNGFAKDVKIKIFNNKNSSYIYRNIKAEDLLKFFERGFTSDKKIGKKISLIKIEIKNQLIKKFGEEL